MNLLNRLKNILVVCVMVLGVASCSSPTVQMYAKEKPQLDLATYFNGDIDAYGIFTNRSGEVVKRFKVVIKAKWETKDGKRVGVLDESIGDIPSLCRSTAQSITSSSMIGCI